MAENSKIEQLKALGYPQASFATDPDGTPGVVPHDQVEKARGAGYTIHEPAVYMTHPDGTPGLVPRSQAKSALDKGYQVGLPIAGDKPRTPQVRQNSNPATDMANQALAAQGLSVHAPTAPLATGNKMQHYNDGVVSRAMGVPLSDDERNRLEGAVNENLHARLSGVPVGDFVAQQRAKVNNEIPVQKGPVAEAAARVGNTVMDLGQTAADIAQSSSSFGTNSHGAERFRETQERLDPQFGQRDTFDPTNVLEAGGQWGQGFAEGMAQPEQLGMLKALGAASPLVRAGANAYFAQSMARNLPEQAVNAYTADNSVDRVAGGMGVATDAAMLADTIHGGRREMQSVDPRAIGQQAGENIIGPVSESAPAQAIVRGVQKPVEIAKKGANAVGSVVSPERYMTAEQAATKAFRPRNSKQNWKEEIASALPDARRAADGLKINVENMTLDDALRSVEQAKVDVWKEYKDNYLDPAHKFTVDASEVADAVRGTISDIVNEQEPKLAKRINRIADTYEGRELDVEHLQNRLKALNNKTRSIEARYLTDKRAAKLDPKNAYVFAERDTVRELLNRAIGEVGGDGADTASAELRRRYGALTSMEDVVSRRIPVGDRKAPVSLTHLLGDLSGYGTIAAGALHGNVPMILGGVAAKLAARQAEKLNNPEFLTQQAFKKTDPRGPILSRAEYMPEPGATSPLIPSFLRKALPQSTRDRGVPESPNVDAVNNREYGDSVTPIGATGKAGTLVRNKGLLPAAPEQKSSIPSFLQKALPHPEVPNGKVVGVDAESGLPVIKRDEVAAQSQASRAPVAEQSRKTSIDADVFHATKASFDKFDPSKGENGIHVGTREHAEEVARNLGKGTRVLPLRLKLENPLRVVDYGDFRGTDLADQALQQGVISQEEWSRVTSKDDSAQHDALRKLLDEKGYDGVVYLNRREGLSPKAKSDEYFDTIESMSDDEFRKEFPEARDSYIAFKPEQIQRKTPTPPVSESAPLPQSKELPVQEPSSKESVKVSPVPVIQKASQTKAKVAKVPVIEAAKRASTKGNGDILYESGDYSVRRAQNGFEVYKAGATASTRVAQIGYAGDKGLQRAKAEIERRQAIEPSQGLSAHGQGAASLEELARKKEFVRVGKQGQVSSMGIRPDATLRDGEAVASVDRNGNIDIQNQNGPIDDRKVIAAVQKMLDARKVEPQSKKFVEKIVAKSDNRSNDTGRNSGTKEGVSGATGQGQARSNGSSEGTGASRDNRGNLGADKAGELVAPKTLPPSDLEGMKKELRLAELQHAPLQNKAIWQMTESQKKTYYENTNYISNLKEQIRQVEAEVKRSGLPKTEPQEKIVIDPDKNKWGYQREYFEKALSPAMDAWKKIIGEPGDKMYDKLTKDDRESPKSKPDGFPDEFIRIEVPNDGKFLVKNTPYAINKLLKSAPQAFAQPSKARGPVTPRGVSETNTDKLIAYHEKELARSEDELAKQKKLGYAYGDRNITAYEDAVKAERENLAEAKRLASVEPTPKKSSDIALIRASKKNMAKQNASKVYTKQEMIDAGADGHLSKAVKMEIPVSEIDGREPVPAMEGGYKKGTEITQPIEVVYDKEQGKYMLYAGNHRVKQAEVNGQKTILAFVENPPKKSSIPAFLKGGKQ